MRGRRRTPRMVRSTCASAGDRQGKVRHLPGASPPRDVRTSPATQASGSVASCRRGRLRSPDSSFHRRRRDAACGRHPRSGSGPSGRALHEEAEPSAADHVRGRDTGSWRRRQRRTPVVPESSISSMKRIIDDVVAVERQDPIRPGVAHPVVPLRRVRVEGTLDQCHIWEARSNRGWRRCSHCRRSEQKGRPPTRRATS